MRINNTICLPSNINMSLSLHLVAVGWRKRITLSSKTHLKDNLVTEKIRRICQLTYI